MTDDTEPKVHRHGGGIPIAVSTACFCLLTFLLLGAYSTVHWEMMDQGGTLHGLVLELGADAMQSGAPMEEHLDELQQAVDALSASRSSVLNTLEVYHLTGLMAFLFSIFSFRARPRWCAFIAVPFGLAGLFGAWIIM